MKRADEKDPFEFPGGKRYLTMDHMLKERFGCKVMKISLNAGFTCPNIDGTLGTGGCSYCSGGSGAFGGKPCESITEQFFSVREKINRKWSSGKYIPYFQAYTNTYGPIEKIRAMTTEALGLPDVCGISLSTRPDCISEETADYLKELSKKTYLTVELGLQTVFDETARRINRCHTYADFLKGFEALRSRGINICVHLIEGLPGENAEMMLETAKTVGRLHPHGIKFHLLHILKGTRIADEYLAGKFDALTLEEYVDIICRCLEVIPTDVCIERLTGDGAPDELIAPLWSLKKFVVLNEIDKEMRRRNTRQGKLL